MRKSKTRSSSNRASAGRNSGGRSLAARVSIGIHAVHEALALHPQWALDVWVKDGFGSSPQSKEILNMAKKAGISVKPVAQRKLDELGSGHQGVALLLRQSPELQESALERESCVCLALDQVSDPHNLGAVLRSAWLLGAQAVFIPEDRSAPLTPTASKVAQGGAEHVPVVPTSPLDQELKRLKEKGFWIFGLSHKAKSSLFEVELPQKVVWVLGAEDSGLRKPVERACDELISIPQASQNASFNVSVAAGMALAESYRQLFFSKASK